MLRAVHVMVASSAREGPMLTPPYLPTLITLTALATILACRPFTRSRRARRTEPDTSSPGARLNAILATRCAVTGAVDLHQRASIASLAPDAPSRCVATVAISKAVRAPSNRVSGALEPALMSSMGIGRKRRHAEFVHHESLARPAWAPVEQPPEVEAR